MINQTKSSVLFICTGNIFRSMTAEYALRSTLGRASDIHVHSAGTIEAPHGIVSFVNDYLQERGIDVSRHIPRKVTREILDVSSIASSIAVAMDFSHRQHMDASFGVRLPLFNEIAYGKASPMPDVWEVVPDWRNNEEAAKEYGRSVMDGIFDGMPEFIERWQSFG